MDKDEIFNNQLQKKNPKTKKKTNRKKKNLT